MITTLSVKSKENRGLRRYLSVIVNSLPRLFCGWMIDFAAVSQTDCLPYMHLCLTSLKYVFQETRGEAVSSAKMVLKELTDCLNQIHSVKHECFNVYAEMIILNNGSKHKERHKDIRLVRHASTSQSGQTNKQTNK